MNNYQFYEEIGKGNHSTVYKGRYKKTIDYYAIKSVEKGQKNRVLNEVTMLTQLKHPNILQFYHWYETGNHLWLIVEYCTGSDVRTLLKQDTSLPEETLSTFATDLVAALGYVHSKGIIYCDLKPSNMLIDDRGFIKLSDFGLACFVCDVTPNKRRIGTPSYMSPELFQDGGVPSFASDLWGMGCVLYEIYVGKPPFTDPKIDTLIHKVVYEDYIRPKGCSRELTDLLEQLLEKDPLERVSWAELVKHEFWKERKLAVPLDLPAQPAFDQYKAKRVAEGTVHRSNREAREKRRKEVARISATAQHNLEKEMQSQTYNEKKSTLEADTEVDFGEAEKEEEGGVGEMAGEVSAPVTPAEDVAPKLSMKQPPPAALTEPPKDSPPPAQLMSPGDVNALLFHPSDSHVKPIMCNTRIEKISDPKFDADALPFPAHTLQEVCNMSDAPLEAFLTQVYKSIGGHTTVGEKFNCLCYLETLCSDTPTANLFINSSLMSLFIKMIQNMSYPPNLKARLCMVMGLLIRHATYIGQELAKTGVVQHFLALFADKSIKVCRRAVACLGELLFYIATQSPADRTAWNVGQDVGEAFSQALHSEDELVKHYAVKTIENITGHSDPEYGRCFAIPNTCGVLLNIFATAKNEHLRNSAISTVARMCRLNHECVLWVMDEVKVEGIASSLLNASNTRALQSILNILNILFAKGILHIKTAGSPAAPYPALLELLKLPGEGRGADAAISPEHIFARDIFSEAKCQKLLADVATHIQTIAHGLTACIEHSSAVIRGKAVLCIYLMGSLDLRHLSVCCECKLFPLLERVAKEREEYVQPCFTTVINFFAKAVPLIVNSLPASHDLLPMAHHALTSPPIRPTSITVELIESLPRAIQHRDTAQQILLLVEAVSQDSSSVKLHHELIISRILPVLAESLASGNGDVRFTSLKITIDILVHYMSDPGIYAPGPSHPIDVFILSSLFPRISALLDDEEPIPLYALKLLNNIASESSSFAAELASLAQTLFTFFELEHRNNNVHNVKLILKLVTGGATPIARLFELGVVRKLNSVLSYAFENAVETFFEPCLEICYSLLVKTHSAGVRYQAQRERKENKEEFQLCLSNCAPLVQNIELYVVLAITAEAAETAANCFLLCAELYTNVELHQALVSPSCRAHLLACLVEHNPAERLDPVDIAVCSCVLRTLRAVLRNPNTKEGALPFPEQIRRDDILISNIRYLTTPPAHAQSSDAFKELSSLANEVLRLALG